MTQAHRLDCDTVATGCRFVVQSEDESEALELAKTHLQDAHGREIAEETLRSEHLKIV